jgi:hypothetical protein
MQVRTKKRWLLLIVGVIVVGLWLRSLGCPPDWVEVHLSDVPAGMKPLYLIADDGKSVRAMHWYHAMVTAFTSDPALAGEQWRWNTTEHERLGDVKWVSAQRYGILALKSDGEWFLWWLGSEDMVGPSRVLSLFGYGKAEIRVPRAVNARTAPAAMIETINIPSDEKNLPGTQRDRILNDTASQNPFPKKPSDP